MRIFETFGLLFDTVGHLYGKGGWLVLFVVGLYLLWQTFYLYNAGNYAKKIKWMMLSIDVPKENEQTLLAAEQIFAQLHAIHTSISFYEKHFQGKFQLWFTFEIVSFGGQIKFLSYLPEQYRDLMEAAIYAQYPDAEIKQVDDYMKNVPQYNPGRSYYDIWGTDFKVRMPDAYPIRTYKYFEHQASQIIVDPLAGILEGLSTIKPHEMLAVQYLFRPVNDKWKQAGRALVKKLKKEKVEVKGNVATDIASDVGAGLVDIASGQTATDDKPKQQQTPLTMMMHLSPGEKDVIAAIEASLSKIGYQTKVRVMYLAPKEKFRKTVRPQIVGAFRQFDDINLNGLKPDTEKTWTDINPKIFEPLEKPFIKYLVKNRKKKMIRFYKNRKFDMGAKPFVFNIEEAATIFHFPLINVKAPQLTKTEVKKGEAPINLPV